MPYKNTDCRIVGKTMFSIIMLQKHVILSEKLTNFSVLLILGDF